MAARYDTKRVAKVALLSWRRHRGILEIAVARWGTVREESRRKTMAQTALCNAETENIRGSINMRHKMYPCPDEFSQTSRSMIFRRFKNTCKTIIIEIGLFSSDCVVTTEFSAAVMTCLEKRLIAMLLLPRGPDLCLCSMSVAVQKLHSPESWFELKSIYMRWVMLTSCTGMGPVDTREQFSHSVEAW